MSLEQLVFIALFILVPLVRALAERRQKQRQVEAAEELSQTLPISEIPGYPSYEPPERPAPADPVPSHPPTFTSAPPMVPTPSVRTPDPEPPRRPPPPPRNVRTVRAGLRAAVPRDRAELRRAILLAEILGPPRSLERHDR